MGEWLRVAKERARVWCVLEAELNSGKEAVRRMVSGWRERGSKMMRQKRRRRGMGNKKRKAPTRRDKGGEDGEEGGSDEDDEHDEDGEGEEEEEEEQDGKKISDPELVPYMSRTSMDYDIPLLLGSGPGGAGGVGGPGSEEKSSLRVQWKIEFDWTGEARSDIRVFVALPGKCEYFFFFLNFFSLTIHIRIRIRIPIRIRRIRIRIHGGKVVYPWNELLTV